MTRACQSPIILGPADPTPRQLPRDRARGILASAIERRIHIEHRLVAGQVLGQLQDISR